MKEVIVTIVSAKTKKPKAVLGFMEHDMIKVQDILMEYKSLYEITTPLMEEHLFLMDALEKNGIPFNDYTPDFNSPFLM